MKKFLELLHYFRREINEFISIPLGLLLFFLFPKLLRLFDNTTAAYDGGVLHSYIAAIAGMLIIHGFVWLLLKLTFPRIYKFFDDVFELMILPDKTNPGAHQTTDKNPLTTWQKCILSLSVFSLYLLSTILLARIF